MSAEIKRGSKIPVEDFSPKTNASITTIIIPIPLMPDLAIPNKNTAKKTANHCAVDKS